MRRFGALLLAAGVLLLAWFPATARAAPSIGVGASAPTTLLLQPLTISASGDATDLAWPSLNVWVVPATPGCAATAEGQWNRYVVDESGGESWWELRERDVSGAYGAAWSLTPTAPGTYVICGYLKWDGGELATSAAGFSVAPALVLLAPPDARAAVTRMKPAVTVTVSGQSDIPARLRVGAVKLPPKTTAADCLQDVPGVPIELAPVPPATLAQDDNGGIAVGPGAFSVQLQGTGESLAGFYGPLRFQVCASVFRPQELVNQDDVYTGDRLFDELVLSTTGKTLTLTRWGPPPRILKLSVLHWKHPAVTTLNVIYRGCTNDSHAFYDLLVNRRTRRFNGKLRFSDGSRGTLTGRFDRRWRKVTGRLAARECRFDFTKRGRYR